MKIYKLFIVALCALAFAACNATQTNSPTQTLKAFVEASKKKDVVEKILHPEETMEKMEKDLETIQKISD